MRRKEKEITDKAIMEKILDSSEVCRIGLVDNGEAYIVPVNYASRDGIIYFHSAPQGKKMDILRKNNKVTFEIEYPGEIMAAETPCEWSAKYRSVMGHGTIETEEEPDAKRKAMDLIMRKYGALGELKYNEASLSRMVILKLKITSMSGKQSGEW